ncbi:MAG: D-alanyl-D-alanine carboxypeptidase family protein [Oscillospiraceae bacterium]
MKRILPLAIVIAMLLNFSSAFAISLSSRGGFVLNSNTNQEVYGHNADTPMVPASMTKVMSLYVIYDHLADGRITKDTMVPVGSALASYSRNPNYSNVPLNSGTYYSVHELLEAITAVSANAAVMVMADYLCGSESGFVNEMNYWVKCWGLIAWFADCSGVSNGNKISPRSMATLANRLITDYPDILNYTSKPMINFRGGSYYSTNKMLPGRAYDYYGTDGLKTGTTSAAGCCFTGTVQRDGTRLVSVIMGAPSTNMRYTDTIKMMDYSWPLISSIPQVEAPVKDYIVATDMRIYINDWEIPTFLHRGDIDRGVVMINDLVDYGFDISYDINTDTVTVLNNTNKEITAGPTYDEQGLYDETHGISISDMEPAKILLKNDENDAGHYVSNVYDLGGKAAICIDELKYMGDLVWNADKKLVVVVTR